MNSYGLYTKTTNFYTKIQFLLNKVEQGLKSLNPRPSLILVDCGKWTSMQNLESVAQKMGEL